jgi:phospholipase C
MANNLANVKSIVVLMMENRSLDNLLGYLYFDQGNVSPNGDAFNGLTGNESNPNSNGSPILVRRESSRNNMPNPDPGEEYAHVNMQLFKSQTPPVPPVATNDGFVLDYLTQQGKAADIMSCYDPSMIPNVAEICRRYALCDAWHAPVPTQTWANRAFAHAATSWGMVNNAPNDPFRWRMPTIFQKMAAISNMPWRIYYDENYMSFTRLQFSPLLKPGYNKNILGFEHFLNDANAGQLPRYSFVEPNFFANPLTKKKESDMHPPSDITPGDEFVARVFNAVITGPQWAKNEVLLVITFDEHGGCYDHVSPPINAVAPDSKKGEFGFDFKRFGVRVPAVVVSPFVKKGSVFHAAPNATPYDHTSILATIEKVNQIAALTKRDAAAPDLGSILTEPARNDASPLPITSDAVVATKAAVQALANQPLNDLQQGMVTAMKRVLGQKAPAAAAPAKAARAAAVRPIATVDDAREFFKDARLALGL